MRVYLLYGEKKSCYLLHQWQIPGWHPLRGRTKVSERAAGASVRFPFIYLLPYDLFVSVHSFFLFFYPRFGVRIRMLSSVTKR